MPRVELGQTNIIFNIPHPSILLQIHDKSTCDTLLFLLQEIKRDIIYSRMNLPPSAQQLTTVPYSGSGIIPRSSLSGAGAVGLVGVLGIWKGRDNWVKGGANGVSLQAT